MDRMTTADLATTTAPPDEPGTPRMPRTAPSVARNPDLRSYFAGIDEVPLLTAEEEKTLGWNIQNDGCTASRDRMVRANLRLVVSIARTFTGRGLELPDLVAEGNLGLLRAVDRFDPAHGARFSTYGSWWIKHAIRRGIRQSREIVHIPAQVQELSARLHREAARHQTISGNSMSAQEMSAMADDSLATKATLRRALSRHPGNGQSSLAAAKEHALPDTRELAPDGRILHREDIARVQVFLRDATAREAAAIRMRFGLDGHAPLTLNRIGEVLGISRESVRKLLGTALRTMGAEMAA